MICARDESHSDASLGHARLDWSQCSKEPSMALQLSSQLPGRQAKPAVWSSLQWVSPASSYTTSSCSDLVFFFFLVAFLR